MCDGDFLMFSAMFMWFYMISSIKKYNMCCHEMNNNLMIKYTPSRHSLEFTWVIKGAQVTEYESKMCLPLIVHSFHINKISHYDIYTVYEDHESFQICAFKISKMTYSRWKLSCDRFCTESEYFQ